MISKLVIVGLILVWAVVLLPDVMSRISRGRRGDTIRSFNTQLSSLGRSAPIHRGDNVIDLRSRTLRPTVGTATRQTAHLHTPQISRPAPRPVSPAVRKRRQDVLITLGAAAVLTLLATVAFGGVFLYVHLVADVLMAIYLVLLQQAGSTQGSTRSVAGAQRARGTGPIPGMAPLGGAVGRAHAVEARRIAN